MPTGKTITAREAGVWLPGMDVLMPRLRPGRKIEMINGVVIIPSHAMESLPHLDADVPVRLLFDECAPEVWVEAALLEHPA